jgi:hypothetical protein
MKIELEDPNDTVVLKFNVSEEDKLVWLSITRDEDKSKVQTIEVNFNELKAAMAALENLL